MGGKSTHAESPRFPVPGSSGQGQSAPKAQPRGEADGNQVNIPEPMHNMVRIFGVCGTASVQVVRPLHTKGIPRKAVRARTKTDTGRRGE